MKADQLDCSEVRARIVKIREFGYSTGKSSGVIEFSDNGKFYNHKTEMEGTWSVVEPTVSKGATLPNLIINYPENKIEGQFTVSKIHKESF